MVDTSIYLIQFDAAASVALSLLGDLLFFFKVNKLISFSIFLFLQFYATTSGKILQM